MKVKKQHYRTLWLENDKVNMIDQNRLPFEFQILTCHTYSDTCKAIKNMNVRGAGAIGSAAAFAMAQAAMQAPPQSYTDFLATAKKEIEQTRPTAQNLFAAVEIVHEAAKNSPQMAYAAAQAYADADVQACKRIGQYGNELIGSNTRIETHCNAGWLAFTDYGSALAPVYEAKRAGKEVFVYVDETRPRNQGARLTAWELHNEDIPHRIIADNAGAFFMQNGDVDMLITGADRIAANGDTANKIGTLEKALAATHFNIPFYVAAPTSTIDFQSPSGKEIPIEFRSEQEVIYQQGVDSDGYLRNFLIASPGSKAMNPAFDVTPAELITAFITEKGIFKPSELSKIL